MSSLNGCYRVETMLFYLADSTGERNEFSKLL